MKPMLVLTRAVAFSLSAGIAGVAAAAWHIDDTGYGFVGKGDVQPVFGWNNAQMQHNADVLQFTYVTSESVSWDCEFDTGNPGNPRSINHHVQTRHTTASVAASVAYDSRRNNKGQVTGFNLLGFGPSDTVVSGPEPLSCPNGGFNLVVTNVLTTEGDEGMLIVDYAGITLPLSPSP